MVGENHEKALRFYFLNGDSGDWLNFLEEAESFFF